MADTRTTLRSISRLAITQMSEADRAGLIAEYLIEFSGPDAIGCLSRVRTTINYRIQQLIDAKFPLRETAEAYGDVPAVHARFAEVIAAGDDHEAAFTAALSETSPEMLGRIRQAIEAAIAGQWSFHDLKDILAELHDVCRSEQDRTGGGQ